MMITCRRHDKNNRSNGYSLDRTVQTGQELGSFRNDYLEDHARTCKWLGSPSFIRHGVRPFGRGPTTRSLGDLPWLLTRYPSPGMILQVVPWVLPPTTRGTGEQKKHRVS